jgi:hypothetical protein
MLPSSAIRIRIPMPTNRTWSAGSYVYLRFLSIKPWESHPFTISSIIASTDVDENKDRGKLSQLHEMVFIIRPHGGLTARLGSLAAAAPSSLHACLVDGPYGGFMDSLRACDMVLLLAGGTGMTTIVPIAQAFSRSTADPGITCCQTRQVHWVMRESGAAEWFKDQLAEIGTIEMYVTGQSELKVAPVSPTKENPDSAVEESTPSFNPGFKHGRPNLNQIVHKAAEQYFGRIGVMSQSSLSVIRESFLLHNH